MVDESKQKAIITFAARAPGYEAESVWVRLRDLIAPLVPEPFGQRRMLDICSGSGTVASYALRLGWSVVASDLSFPMLSRSTAPSRVAADAVALPFEPRAFELLTVRQGLQYLPLHEALVEWKRVSRSHIRLGHITMEDAADESWWRRYFELASPGRRHIFAPGRIAEVCEEAGLRVATQRVLRTMDLLQGPIKHLSAEIRASIVKMWIDAPPRVVERYKVRRTAGGDFEYSHRWEFITLQVD